jgi:6-phosphogluconolactonase
MKTLHTLAATAVAAASLMLHAETYTVYVGTYTSPTGSKGIYHFGFDAATGAVTSPVELAAESAGPSFLAIHPNGRFLYAVNEGDTFEGKKQGSVSAFSINKQTHKLAALNKQGAGGTGPCHLNVDREGKNVLVANYGGGSIAVLPIDGDGGLKAASSFIQHTGSSVNASRQKEPHAHSINLDRSGKHAFVCDLGLDKVLVYNFNSAEGKLTYADAAAVAPGSGPRHFAFSPDFSRAYAINELSQTVTAFSYNGKGKLTQMQTISTVPQETPGNSTAEVVVHPSGKFVYGSNRGHDTIAVFSVDPKDAQLTRIQNEPIQGKVPRNFAIDPTGKFLLAAGQESNTIAIFKIDQATGKLTYTGKSLEVPKPVCVRFLKD